jgi:hypothetical protein
MIGTATEFRVAVALLNRIDGLPVDQCWPTEPAPDPRTLSEMLADWKEQRGDLPPMFMSIKLIVEILDHWQDFGLTPGERDDLIVIAEQARDETRRTVASIHQAFVLKRAGKSTRAAWDNSISKLIRKKVLENAVVDGRRAVGRPGQAAQYYIPHLCPEHDHDGRLGQCKPLERLTLEVRRDADSSHTSGETNISTSHLPDEERLTSQVRTSHLSGEPYPSYPSYPSEKRSTRTGGSSNDGSHHVDRLFEAFWEHYPKKTAKDTARSSWRRVINDGADPQEIITGAEKYAAEWDGAPASERHFITKASNWLKDEMWTGTWHPRTTVRAPGQQRGGSRFGAGATIPSHDDYANGKATIQWD